MTRSVQIYLSINIIVVVTHLLALTLLIKFKLDNLNGSQKCLLVSLCLTELALGVDSILMCIITIIHIDHGDTIEEIMSIFLFTPLYLMYFSIMILITLDRLLEFRLNIKYSLFWSPKRTLVALLVVISISMTIFICIIILTRLYNFMTLKFYEEFLMKLMIPIFSSFFIVLASYTYYQIYKKIKKNREKAYKNKNIYEVRNLHKEMDSNRRKRFQVFLPSLIIATFILFSIVPYLIWTIRYHVCKDCNEYVNSVIALLYPLGWLADPIIYIFSLRPIRMRIREAFLRFSNESKEQNSFPRLSHRGSKMDLKDLR